MTRVYIIHGCPSDAEKAMDPETRTYDKHWLPWATEKLREKGYDAKMPFMPNPWAPDYDAYKTEFEKNQIDEDSILIGTSCGAAFLVRWLGDTKKKVAKLILVAPWKFADDDKPLQQKFYGYDIDPTISDRVRDIIMFTSDTEWEEGKRSLKTFHDVLGGTIIDLPNHGHYIEKHMGTREFPELLSAVG